MHSIKGVVTILQESRFQLIDDDGVAHLCILGPHTLAEPDQLEALQRRQVRVTLRYERPASVIGLLVHSLATEE